MLRIYLFGHLRVMADGSTLKFLLPPKAVSLWAYLLLHRSTPTPRDSLAYTLWPDVSESAARANLRRHLHLLQRALPSALPDLPWLHSDAVTIRWNPHADDWCDVAEFERLSTDSTRLADAVALYTGDLLESLYDDWIFSARERLRNLDFADLNQLILQCRTRRDYPAAIAYAQQVLNRDPLHSDTVRQLMTLRYESGDGAGALQVYKRFVRLLRDELGVEPMPEMVALYEAIIKNARLPGSVPLAEAVVADDQMHGATLPFVGREAEMEQLGIWWGRAARGQGCVIMIGGEAGIGKSRLSAELAGQAEREGARVLVGSTAFAESAPYQAIVDALRSALPLIAVLDIDALWLAAVASLIPELRTRRPKLPILPPLDPDREQTRVFEGLARTLEALAQPRPVLLILEDLHRAGAATIALLEYLARRVSRHSLLILVNYRDEETSRTHPLRDLRRRLQREDLVNHLALGRLGSQAVESLVAQVYGLDTKASELAQRLYAECEGNPLFLGELIRDLLESGQSQHAFKSTPSGINGIIAGRVARLSEQTRLLVGIAAVVGEAFDVELVVQVSGWSEDQVHKCLGELIDHQVVREMGGSHRSDYAFTHHLIQAAIYAEIPADDRQRRHRRVAQIMEEMYPQQLDELATQMALHFDQGNDPTSATPYYLRAGRHALAVSAADEALAYLTRGLELAVNPRLRFDLYALCETIHGRRGQRGEQRADLEQLDQLAHSLAEQNLVCDSLSRQILYERALGDREAEARCIAALTACAVSSGDRHWQIEALQAEATHQLLLGKFDDARAMLERVLRLRESLGETSSQAECYSLLAEAEVLQGHFSQAQKMLSRAAAVAGVQTNQSLLVQTLRSAAIAAMVQVDIDTAYALGQQMLELCQASGDRVGEADAHTRLGAAAARLFRVAEARERYEQAEDMYALLGDRKGQAATLINAAMLMANLGNYGAAMAQDRKAEALFLSLNDLRGQAIAAINFAWHAILQGAYATAAESAARGLEQARSMKSQVYEAYALSNLGAAERELGALPQAIEHIQAGINLRRKLGQAVELATDLTDLTITYLRTGDTNAARRTADEMLRILTADPDHMTYPQYILWAAAQTYRATGETEQSGAFLARAYTTLQQKASIIPDPPSRTTFLQIPFNRELLAAFEHGEWPAQSQPPSTS
jgi:predicted ATPase/DNA-binding SARP family transcriptional activator